MQPYPRYQRGDKIAGRYQVHQALMGGMGEVYLCLDLETIQPFALKTFQARFLTNPRVRDLFKEEVATWVILEKHPNIVRCFYMDIIDNQPFMILEWIAGDESRGTDLRSWLRHGPLDLRLALDFTIDICRGLIHAGQKQPGIVHRDLKPENILVAQGRLAKITDWGLAKIVKETELAISAAESEPGERQGLVGAGGIVGTPAYMAPEQWRGEELDVRTDIYAVGCILYEMLAGCKPFEAMSVDGFRYQHLEAAIPSLMDNEDLPPAVDKVLSHCLTKRKDERLASVDELLRQLSEVYQRQFAKTPKAVVITEKFTAVDYSNRAMTYARLGRYDDARMDYTQAIQLDPTLTQAYVGRGAVHAELQHFDEALADYDRAIQLNRNDAQAYTNRGNTYYDLRRYDEALADFNRAIHLDPVLVEALTSRGRLYADREQYDEALRDFNRSIHLNPKYAKAYYNRGLIYANLQQRDAALNDYSCAIRLDPTLAPAYVGRGIICAVQESYDKAEADFRRAIELDPGSSTAYLNMGALLTNQGRLQGALGYLEKAAEFGDSEAEQHVVLVKHGIAFEAFRHASTPDEVYEIVSEFPYMADSDFIAAAEHTIAQGVSLEEQPAFNQRLAWLRQIAEEQKRQERDE